MNFGANVDVRSVFAFLDTIADTNFLTIYCHSPGGVTLQRPYEVRHFIRYNTQSPQGEMQAVKWDIDTGILSVRPSVRLSRSGIVSMQLNVSSHCLQRYECSYYVPVSVGKGQ